MKQENAIAGIMKEHFEFSKEKLHPEYYRTKVIIRDLADYFEKENPPFTQYFKKYGFDKKQFLKDCGVE